MVSGGNLFGKVIVGYGGLAILIASVILAVSVARGKNPVRGTAKSITLFLGLMHFGIFLCWFRFPASWIWSVIHFGMVLASLVYLCGLIYESETLAFWTDYEFRPWEANRS